MVGVRTPRKYGGLGVVGGGLGVVVVVVGVVVGGGGCRW